MKKIFLCICFVFSAVAGEFPSLVEEYLNYEVGTKAYTSDELLSQVQKDMETAIAKVSSGEQKAIKRVFAEIENGKISSLNGITLTVDIPKLMPLIRTQLSLKALTVYLYWLRVPNGILGEEKLNSRIQQALYLEFSQRMRAINDTYIKNYVLNDVALRRLHQLKNGLSLEYSFFRVSDLGRKKKTDFEKKLGEIFANLDILIGTNGRWNDLPSMLRQFEEKYVPAAIDSKMVQSQVLMAYISNGYVDPSMLFAYSFMKEHVRGKLKHMYRDIYFFFTEYDELHPGSHFMTAESAVRPTEDIYTDNLALFQQDSSIKNIDFFWQAHSGDAPLTMSIDGKPTVWGQEGAVTKLRYVNNTWCFGSSEYQESFPEIPARAKYSPGAVGINNPFPYNFAINFFTGLNIPVGLSEVMARLTQETFYNQILSNFITEEKGYLHSKDEFYVYSSWVDIYGQGNFSLADKDFSVDNNKLLGLDDSFFIKPEMNTDHSFDGEAKTYAPTDFQAKLIERVADFMSCLGMDLEWYGINLEGLQFKQPSLNKFLQNITGSLNTTLLIFADRDIKASQNSNWDVFPLSDTLLRDFRDIALSKYLSERGDAVDLLRYFISKLQKITVSSRKDKTQLRLQLSFDKPIVGYSPFLTRLTKEFIYTGIDLVDQIDWIKGFDISRNVQLDVEFVGEDRISIKGRGIKIISELSAAIELPEIIFNHGTGELQLLRKGFPVYKVEL